jgi:beta-phosphoglucomutase
MKYCGAIFDVDGVLVDTPHERAWREALDRLMAGPYRALAAEWGYRPGQLSSALYQAHVAGKPRLAGAAAALEAVGLPDPGGVLAQRYAAEKQTLIDELIERSAFERFADGERLLLRLRARGLRLAAASSSKNANAFLARIATAPGESMLTLFDANLCGRDFAEGKPHPAIFLAAAEALGLAPARCVVFEDAPAGVVAAKAAGMGAVGVARLDDAALLRAAGADLVVRDLDAVELEIL